MHRGVARGRPATIFIDGVEVQAYLGETVAGAAMAAGVRVLRRSLRTHEPRGMFCGIGVCYECLVTVDGVPDVRACLASVEHGMVIELVPPRAV